MATLRGKSWRFPAVRLTAGSPNPFAGAEGEWLEVNVDMQPSADSEVSLTVNGLEITYDAAKQEISAGGIKAPAPLQDGRQHITVFADRTMFIIFASDGLTYMPIPRISEAKARGVSLQTKSGTAVAGAEVFALKSIWASSGQ